MVVNMKKGIDGSSLQTCKRWWGKIYIERFRLALER